MLENSETDEFGSSCTDGENVLLFLTDGEPTVGYHTSSDLINLINSYSRQITLFTYALGNSVDLPLLKALSCAYDGITFQVAYDASASELTTIMRNYYVYISEGVSITKPVWTEPYDDAFGFGRLVTVSMPIYYE